MVTSLYAANQSFHAKKPLIIRDIYDTSGTFADGVLAAFRSIGLINFKVGEGNAIDVLNVGPFNGELFATIFQEMQTTDAGKKAFDHLEGASV